MQKRILITAVLASLSFSPVPAFALSGSTGTGATNGVTTQGGQDLASGQGAMAASTTGTGGAVQGNTAIGYNSAADPAGTNNAGVGGATAVGAGSAAGYEGTATGAGSNAAAGGTAIGSGATTAGGGTGRRNQRRGTWEWGVHRSGRHG